jgi:tripeptidyl-peptidase-1
MFQTTFGLPQQAAKTNQFGDFSSDCSYGLCYEGNLDVQYIMGIAQNVETTYDYELTDQYDFLSNWIMSVSNTATPANVYSISWGMMEVFLSTSFADVFNTELIKLGVMGTTVLASSGDDGVSSFEARGNPSFCGYSPLFTASSPYVVAVGGTNVSTYPLSPVDVLDI